MVSAPSCSSKWEGRYRNGCIARSAKWLHTLAKAHLKALVCRRRYCRLSASHIKSLAPHQGLSSYTLQGFTDQHGGSAQIIRDEWSPQGNTCSSQGGVESYWTFSVAVAARLTYQVWTVYLRLMQLPQRKHQMESGKRRRWARLWPTYRNH